MTARPVLSLLLAAPDCAEGYRQAQLDRQDCKRLQRSPGLAARADWQVSRYLKQQTALPLVSLSHSKGAALLAASAEPLQAGVDIEYMRLRDFEALAGYSCSPQERQWLTQRGWQSRDYYRLWSLKEALIKAGGLDFPADMPRIGAVWDSDGLMRLQDCGGRSWQGISAFCGDWALACVWHAAHPPEIEWRFFGAFAEQQAPLQDLWRL